MGSNGIHGREVAGDDLEGAVADRRANAVQPTPLIVSAISP